MYMYRPLEFTVLVVAEAICSPKEARPFWFSTALVVDKQPWGKPLAAVADIHRTWLVGVASVQVPGSVGEVLWADTALIVVAVVALDILQAPAWDNLAQRRTIDFVVAVAAVDMPAVVTSCRMDAAVEWEEPHAPLDMAASLVLVDSMDSRLVVAEAPLDMPYWDLLPGPKLPTDLQPHWRR
mmetsp:Transcript_19586/g.31545  ORF Transcript_19586/g.31545 Transcript_19586/m.31545 type:complete len:182 (-) Transcript_19586:1362-1907(-)